MMNLLKLMFLMSLSINLITLFLTHPIMKGFMLIVQTIILSGVILLVKESSWFSLNLLISFLGGVLILFIYVISMIENKKIILKPNLLVIMTLFFLFIFMKMDLNMELDIKSNQLNQQMKMKGMMFVVKLFSKSYYKVSLFMVIYLFLTMISIFKMLSSKKLNLNMNSKKQG